MRGLRALGVALALSACSGRTDSPQPGPAPASGALRSGVVARVGSVEIPAETVGRIAAAQHVDVAAARDMAIQDALLASGAKASGLDAKRDVQFAIDALLARAMLRERSEE